MFCCRTPLSRRFVTTDTVCYMPLTVVRWQRPVFWSNLAVSGNNRFSAFFSSLYHVVQESVGCTDFFPLGIFKTQDGGQDVVRAMNEVDGKCRFSGSDSSKTL